MYVVPKDERYFVLSKNGKLKQFDNYLKLLEWFKLGYYWRHQHRPYYPEQEKIRKVGHNWNENCEYIVFDSLNRVVDAGRLAADVKRLEEQEDERMANRRRRSISEWRIRNNWLGFRNGPVPHTGYGNKAGGRGFKKMRTTQELRRNSWDGRYARAKRTRRYLPNNWDDVRYGRRAYKSWKNQKKRKQWM